MAVIAAFCQTPGALWQAFIVGVMAYAGPETPPPTTIALTSFNGYRSISVHRPESGDPNFYHYVLTSLKSTDIAPARFFVDSNGFQGSAFWYVIPPTGNLELWDDFWAENIVETKQAILSDWSDGAPGDPQYASINGLANGIKSSAATMLVLTESEALATIDQLFLAMTTDGDWTLNLQQTQATPFGPGLNVSVGFNTSAIVEAINQIAFQDFDIQFNHGQTIFSVRGHANGGS